MIQLIVRTYSSVIKEIERWIYRCISALFLCLMVFEGSAQKVIQSPNQLWFAYFNQVRLSDRWGIWTDFHLRTREEFVKDFSIGIARIGLTYYLNDQTRFTTGYAYINHFPTDGHLNISRPEHRPWQQIQWQTPFSRLRMVHALRLEERYRRKILNDNTLAEGHLFNFRTRYNFLIQFPLSKRAFQPGTVSLVVNDELHINFGKEIVYNTFDQNRFFAGLNVHLNANNNLQFGYLNVFQQLAVGNAYRNIHAARVFYFHQIDLRLAEK